MDKHLVTSLRPVRGFGFCLLCLRSDFPRDDCGIQLEPRNSFDWAKHCTSGFRPVLADYSLDDRQIRRALIADEQLGRSQGVESGGSTHDKPW
jgi:hypothetical protein